MIFEVSQFDKHENLIPKSRDSTIWLLMSTFVVKKTWQRTFFLKLPLSDKARLVKSFVWEYFLGINCVTIHHVSTLSFFNEIYFAALMNYLEYNYGVIVVEASISLERIDMLSAYLWTSYVQK